MKSFFKKVVLEVLPIISSPLLRKSQHNISDLKNYEIELQNDFKKLPLLNEDTEFESQNEWHRNLNELRSAIINRGGKRFLKYNVVQRTMFITFANYTRIELNLLMKRKDWGLRWKQALKETRVGYPTPYIFWPRSSSNLIHHAYHLSVFEDELEFPPSSVDVAFEFGGGYGSMCRLFFSLGFKGLYIIYDFPHFSKIQKFFLRSAGYRSLTVDEASCGESGFVCISNINDLEALMTVIHPERKRSLFLATWSLSESPITVRESIKKVIGLFKYSLIAYQKVFNEIDNEKYFSSLFLNSKYQIKRQEIEFLKNNFYFLTKKNTEESALIENKSL